MRTILLSYLIASLLAIGLAFLVHKPESVKVMRGMHNRSDWGQEP